LFGQGFAPHGRLVGLAAIAGLLVWGSCGGEASGLTLLKKNLPTMSNCAGPGRL
jgi:hypothetical protein